MRSVLFLSGKGGTGKTSLAGAFAVLAEEKVLADCDVDAANLHLLLDPKITAEGNFQGGKLAVIDDERCTSCGVCLEVCRFNAIDADFNIDPYMCEGCGTCAYVCPVDAITLSMVDSGRWYTAESRLGPLSSAELYPGQETSGKLVAVVKQKAAQLTKETNAKFLLIDGSPGIGCPVIASASGVDYVILVTEPSLSGLHDLKRILAVVRHFRIPTWLVLNKADLNDEISEKLTEFAAEEGLPILGRIPYDESVTTAMINGKSAVEYTDSLAGAAMKQVYNKFIEAIHAGG